MVERQIDESVITADRWSKVIALFVAIGTFLVAAQLTEDVQFNMIVAAFAGIGVRIYVPYHASITVPDHEPIQAYEGTGNYHHGAVGAAVVIASFAALAVMAIAQNSTPALATGAGVGIASALLLRVILPS